MHQPVIQYNIHLNFYPPLTSLKIKNPHTISLNQEYLHEDISPIYRMKNTALISYMSGFVHFQPLVTLNLTCLYLSFATPYRLCLIKSDKFSICRELDRDQDYTPFAGN